MTISKDRVKPSPHPDSWKLKEIFITGIVYGTYMAVMTVVFFYAMTSTNFFSVSIGQSLETKTQIERATMLVAWG
jgi:H+-transporting ATPase